MDTVLESKTYPKTMITVHHAAPDAKKYCFTVQVNGQSILTTVTGVPFTSREWVLEEWKKGNPPRHFGFEVEMDVTTHRLGTLQICSPDRCLILQLDYTENYLPPTLRRFLTDPENVFISPYVVSKVALLKASFPHGFDADLQLGEIAAHSPFIKELKEKELDSMGLGAVDTTWDRLPGRRLTTEQVHYACLDAFLNRHASRVRVPIFR